MSMEEEGKRGQTMPDKKPWFPRAWIAYDENLSARRPRHGIRTSTSTMSDFSSADTIANSVERERQIRGSESGGSSSTTTTTKYPRNDSFSLYVFTRLWLCNHWQLLRVWALFKSSLSCSLKTSRSNVFPFPLTLVSMTCSTVNGIPASPVSREMTRNANCSARDEHLRSSG